MSESKTRILPYSPEALQECAQLLRDGKLVGMPTETVYGLGGNAYSKRSIEKIFKLKGRPKSNPLIIHYFNLSKALKDVEINKNFLKLYKKFCPGPITFILNKKINSKINPLASAKLTTVAVRFPKHKVIRTILKKINFPLAMPSANKSFNVSPVCALDVVDEFKKKVKLIIDGGKSKIGIESTVIDLTKFPEILRPGIIDNSLIKKILKSKLIKRSKSKRLRSPGMMKKHYSPGLPVLINQKKHDAKSAFIYLGKRYKKNKYFFSLSEKSNLKEAASNLYKLLRTIKRKGYEKIQIGKIPNKGSGIAINDRIKRASKN